MHVAAERLKVVEGRLVTYVAGADEMLCRRAAAREQGIQPGTTTPASRPCAGSDRVGIKTSGGLYLARHEKRLEFLRNVRGPVRDVKVADHEDEHLDERKKADGVDLVSGAMRGRAG